MESPAGAVSRLGGTTRRVAIPGWKCRGSSHHCNLGRDFRQTVGKSC